MTKKILISLAAIAALALGVLYGKGLLNVHQGDHPPATLAALVPEKAPKSAPDIGFTDAKGVRHALTELKGRYVLLNMWATWCAPCVSELPALAQLKRSVPSLKVIAVDLTGHETPGQADAFLKSHHAGALDTLVDTEVTLMRSFGVAALPTTVLIDPTGKVIARAEGPAQWSAPESVDYFKNLAGS